MKKYLLLLFLLLLPHPIWGAVAYDTGSAATATGEIVDTLSVNVTVNVGCANAVVIGTVTWWDDVLGSVSSFNIGGAGATFINGVSPGAGVVNRRVEMWGRVVSSGVVAVEANLDDLRGRVTVSGRSYCGVHQTVSTGTSATADNNGNDAIATVSAGSATDDLVIDAVTTSSGAATIAADGSQSVRVNSTAHAGFYVYGASDKTGGASSTTMTWTANTDDYTGIVAVALKPAAAPGGVARRRIVVVP